MISFQRKLRVIEVLLQIFSKNIYQIDNQGVNLAINLGQRLRTSISSSRPLAVSLWIWNQPKHQHTCVILIFRLLVEILPLYLHQI